MAADQGLGGDLRRIIRLAPQCDPTSLALTAEEGFLLSRIDGATPWRLLREIGGMDADEADLCLEGWLANGLVEVAGLASEEKRRNGTKVRAVRQRDVGAGRTELDESLIDAELDLDIDVQRRILSFELGLEQDYYSLLSVEKSAETKDIKRAYFKLSKEFHPDRYFRRNIGAYAERLERIFKKVLEGYEILSDPDLRAGLDEAEAVKVEPQSAGPFSSPCGEPAGPQRPLTKLERLRQRMPFRIPEKVLVERRRQAEELFKAAHLSERSGQLVEAASAVRVAISFDSTNAEYRRMLVDLQARIAEKKANELLAEGTSYSTDSTQLRKVLRILEDVLLYRPHDPGINDRAAAVSLMLGQYKPALEYAETAVEHSPEVGKYHTMLGLVYKETADVGHAKKEFERALKLDSDDVEARKGLASLRLGRVSAAQGG
ncbi:MAG: DnaJ domain-containing protein [Deltaproteobacteria bacterium]|nr:DnaJ domain-containing protein [Deltaproteobacteria bacterium]